jgi:1-acyl-sn-glycerol-3-phosphate acyltransferase
LLVATPAVGPEIPRRGSRVLAVLGRLALGLGGWRFAGEIPNAPKLIFIVAPHTSNWDFVLGILAVFALDIRASFLGKHTLFRGPMGVFMRWLGGMPVVRHARQNVVDQTVGLIRSAPRVALGLSPEGTRRKLPRWRTGFYYVARGADVPIVPVALDYATRTIRFFEPHRTTPSVEADLAKLGSLFNPGMALHPSQY